MVWTGSLQIVLDKGQEDDWFGATWVRWTVAALVVSLTLWIWHSWTHPKGLVDLHVLKDRNFRTGCFLIAMLGMCIYITIAILPLYYQEVLGYTAFTAGLVVGPRGIGSFIGSPIIGILGSRIDNRKLLCAGFLGFAVCALIFGTVDLDIGPYTLLIPIMLTGFALSFVFVPLSTMMMATISNKEMGNATGLANMLRNIGGSIGISMATTALIRRAALHQTDLGANLTQPSIVLPAEVRRHRRLPRPPPRPRPGPPRLLGPPLRPHEQQSALMAYVDVFRWTAVLAFFCAAAAWLFKKPYSSIRPLKMS
jgi:DHA2 family multidrug resistance protein